MGANLDVVMPRSQNNVLLLAARNGDIDLLKLLLEEGVDVNSVNAGNTNALMTAISYQHDAAAKLLIDVGKNIKHSNRTGMTALHYAAGFDRKGNIAKLLISKGAITEVLDDIESEPIITAASYGNNTIIDILLANGVSLAKFDQSKTFTPLMAAAANNKPDTVEYFLKKNARIDSQDKMGRTAIIWAARYGCVDCVRQLIDKGGKLDLRDNRGLTAVDHAKQEPKNQQIIQLLERAMAKLHRTTRR